MLLFLVQQEIDYSTAISQVSDPNSVAGGSRGATAVDCVMTHGAVGAPFLVAQEGNLLLNTSMIVDMGGRPLKFASGAEVSSRESSVQRLDSIIAELGMD